MQGLCRPAIARNDFAADLPGMEPFADIPTPAAVVDLDRTDANLDRMQAYVDAHKLRLRPHTKTHKAPWLAREQIRRGATGLTVATPIEAERIGPETDDLLVAYPALGRRAERLAALARHRRLLVGLDSAVAVREIRRAAEAAGVTEPIGVLVELDVGMRRCGVGTAASAIEVARACGDAVEYRGVMFYPGHIRQRVEEQEDALARLRRTLGDRLRVLADAGLEARIVSGGSTPTAFRSHDVPQQTEIRPGTYVFNDRTTAAIGACAIDDCAYTILTTVVSTAVPGQAVVDAGSKSLSSDPLRAEGFGGFGQLLDRPAVRVERMSEEHGILDLSGTDWRPRVGERVRIIPNHVCVSVNLQPRVFGVRDGEVEREWEVEARGWHEPVA
jgi:D-serine deaminase-like pyridoxal phosphate-dependent protein